ncbi:MAG: imidazolonepropionase [Verrucomicrobiales bacterium]|nr:imidazolonepropionase [Verrucomicrobiales bacterium]
MNKTLLLTGIRELLTLCGLVPRRARALGEPTIIRDAAVLVSDGLIAAVGRRRDVARLSEARRAKALDLGGKVALPGFVDSHTHLVFPASRAEEYEKRVAGATYEEIARSGGGILSTVRKLRSSPAKELKKGALASLQQMAAHGTTTLEAKSGYGLNFASEVKTLMVLRELRMEQPLEIVPTFLGAHVVPPEYRRRPDAYVKLLIQQMIPIVARQGLAEFCDVYCDRGAFTVEQTRMILTAGRVCGLEPRIHAEQIARTGGARLAVDLNAASADHLEKATAADIRTLANSNVVATLLPGCCFHLGLKEYPPARKLIESGAIVALATDYNPGTSPTLSMQMILSLACARMRMTPAEAIAAATINPAYSLRRHGRIGSLEVGKQADLAVFDVADYREIPYYFGVNQCRMTVKRGQVVYDSDSWL